MSCTNVAHGTTAPPPLARRRSAALAAIGILLAAFTSLAFTPAPAFAATAGVSQCNGVGPSAAGATTAMTCTVEVWNTIAKGLTSSVLTVTRHCSLGPCLPGNGSFTTRSSSLITDIQQCNGSDNDAAHPIRCDVLVHNTISSDTPGAEPLATATVNQCAGSAQGGGGSTHCGPYPATTTGATVTQCNGSANGGGAIIACTVATASQISRAVPVRINQCNGTGNPGGSSVTCNVRIATSLVTLRPPSSTTSRTTGTPGAAVPTAGARPRVSARTSRPSAGPTGRTASGTPTSISPLVRGQVTHVPRGGVQAGGGLPDPSAPSRDLPYGLLLVAAGAAAAAYRDRGTRSTS